MTVLGAVQARDVVQPAEQRLLARFWPKVDRSGGPDACWPWMGARTGHGYGHLSRGPRGAGNVIAHRLAYELLVGPIPAGLEPDHLCRNHACCNPAHLEPVTHAENCRRGTGFSGRNARKTHCPQGHPLAGKHLRITAAGRSCRTCKNTRRRVAVRQPHPANDPARRADWIRHISAARRASEDAA